MPGGIGVAQIAGLVREIRRFEGPSPIIAISGPGAAEWATSLAAGGDRRAVVVDDNPGAAAVVARIVEGDPDERERAVLRRHTNGQTPVVVLRRGGSARIPGVLPDDVVELGSDDPEACIGEVAAAIARAAGPVGPPLAARLPVLFGPVSRRLIEQTALSNAAIAASPHGVPQLPLLAFAQTRMLLLGGVAKGETLPRDPEGLLRRAGPYVVAALGTGIGARAFIRRLPVRGRIVQAAIAYAGTRTLGTVLLRRS